MQKIELPHLFKPYTYQEKLLNALILDGYRHIFWFVHRRAGKDKTCLNALISAALRRVGTYLYILPQVNQARRVIWDGIDGEGLHFMDHIPREIIQKKNNMTMSVKLLNGSVLQFAGSNKYDSWMGSNPIGIVYSEFSLHTPLAREFYDPILTQNKGFEILQGTPRGKNHAWHVRQFCQNNPQWYYEELTVDDTKDNDGNPIITPEQIEERRRAGISDEIIRQEYYLDWNVGIKGAYFTEEMDRMDAEGRICEMPIIPGSTAFTAWDLGVNDPTSIIIFQANGQYIDIIDYVEQTDKGVDYFVKLLDSRAQYLGINYLYHFGPHDLMKREWGNSAQSMLRSAQNLGLHFLRVPDVGFDNGIQACRAIFPRVRIHAKNCPALIDSLRQYQRLWDPETLSYAPKAFHNWASHAADAFRYLAVAWRENLQRPEKSVIPFRNEF